MHCTRSSMKLAALIATVCASLALPVAAQTETVLHNMKTKEGTSPMLGLIFDSSGTSTVLPVKGGIQLWFSF